MLARDLPRVLEIEKEAFSQPWSAASFRRLLERAGALGRVLIEGTRAGSVLGYGVLFVVADEAELANFAVAPEVRGRGLGGRFLDALLGELGGLGVRKVFLEVRSSNRRALRLYESRGFQIIGRRASYYVRPVEDAWVFKKEL